jgi:hypothetical protein
MANKQDKAISQANALISLVGQFQSLRSAVNEYVNQYNSEAYNTVWNALATAAQNTDGSLGTADGTPNVAHPIDTRVVTALSRAVSANQLISAVTYFMDYQKFLTNQAVSTTQRSQTIDDLVS